MLLLNKTTTRTPACVCASQSSPDGSAGIGVGLPSREAPHGYPEVISPGSSLPPPRLSPCFGALGTGSRGTAGHAAAWDPAIAQPRRVGAPGTRGPSRPPAHTPRQQSSRSQRRGSRRSRALPRWSLTLRWASPGRGSATVRGRPPLRDGVLRRLQDKEGGCVLSRPWRRFSFYSSVCSLETSPFTHRHVLVSRTDSIHASPKASERLPAGNEVCSGSLKFFTQNASEGDALLAAGPLQEKFLLTEYNKQKGSLRTQAPGSFIYWAAKR